MFSLKRLRNIQKIYLLLTKKLVLDSYEEDKPKIMKFALTQDNELDLTQNPFSLKARSQLWVIVSEWGLVRDPNDSTFISSKSCLRSKVKVFYASIMVWMVSNINLPLNGS